MSTASIISKITTPTNPPKLNNIPKIASLFSAPILASAAVNTMSDNNDLYFETNENIVVESDKELNFWQFLRLYKIAQIPIMDLIIIYVLIYCVNSIYLNYNYKWVLLMTIPITVLFNILTNKEFKLSAIIMAMLIITLYYLLTSNFIN